MKVADSYTNFEYDETKAYEKNGKMYVSAKMKCDRCAGGIYVTRVENGQPIPHPAYNGVCLKCGGSGILQKEIRLYSDKEYETMKKNKERAAAKKEEMREATMVSQAETKKAEWLEKNGFNEDYVTYIYFPDDSYDRKETLKAAGFRFSKDLLWHSSAAPADFENSCIEVKLSDVAELTAWGEGMYKSNARKIVDSLIVAARPEVTSTSEWQGEVGKRLYDIKCILKRIREISTQYGETQLVEFEDSNGNIYQWWTTVEVNAEAGEEIFLTGTVKKHDEYKGVKSTVLNRCKIKAM